MLTPCNKEALFPNDIQLQGQNKGIGQEKRIATKCTSIKACKRNLRSSLGLCVRRMANKLALFCMAAVVTRLNTLINL